ncbi:DUF5719 family protein [Citricoccus parietis]|uniref:DUF5719 family protein n=1 Tax=Citricoccus parietis TaxID=592307 RepID=A0ABV6F2B3_9MICC
MSGQDHDRQPDASSTPDGSGTPSQDSLQDPPASRGQLKGQRAAAARDLKRQAALEAHQRGVVRRAPMTAGLAGAGVVVLVAAAVTAGTLVPPATPEVDGRAAPAALNAVPVRSVCAGPPRLPAGAEEGTDTQFSPVSTSAVSRVTSVLLSDLAGRFPGTSISTLQSAENGESGEGAEPVDLTESQPEEVQQGDPATAGADGVLVRESAVDHLESPGGEAGEATAVTVEPIGGQAMPSDAVSLYSATDGDLAGTDASSCLAPAHEHWLTGMTTTVGSTSILVLSNPSASASTVDLTLYGADGPVEAPGTAGIVLAPGQTRSIVLGGMAPDEEHLAVQVRAQGGAVGATAQQHRLFGITPGGVEVIQPTSNPSRGVVMPGLVVPNRAVTEEIVGQDGYEQAGPALSLAAPTSAATAEITVSGPDGTVELPEGGLVDIGAGSTVRFPLDGLDDGVYTVTVSADAPVAASARGLSGQAGEPVDFSSVSAVDSLGLERLVARPENTTANLVLYSADGGAVEITPVSEDGSLGESRVQELGPESTRALSFEDLAGGEGGVPSGALLETVEGQVYAAVDVRGEQGISAYPVVPQQEQVSGVPVRVGY